MNTLVVATLPHDALRDTLLANACRLRMTRQVAHTAAHSCRLSAAGAIRHSMLRFGEAKVNGV